MEKEFVTYEVAKKLKELGFDNVPCLGVYYTNETEGAFEIDSSIRDTQYYSKKGFRDGILAPLWQQAIDWLREKKIKVVEIPNFDWEIYIYRDDVGMAMYHSAYSMPSLESAILKAIELITKK